MARLERARRSILAVPAGRPEMIKKAQTLGADQIFLDLEDATAPCTREAARANIHQAIGGQSRGFIAPWVSIRINVIGSPDIRADLDLLAGGVAHAIDSIIVPKVNSLHDLQWIETELLTIEGTLGIERGSIAIDAQIESSLGLVNVNEIAGCARVSSLSFGPLDFLADIGAPTLQINETNRGLISYAQMGILVAARSAGKLAFDGPSVDYKNTDDFEKSAKAIYSMGFDGKWLIHPNQIAPCHEIFTPTQLDFAAALKLLADYDEQSRMGIGAIESAGVMVDAASVRMALVIKARGVAANMVV